MSTLNTTIEFIHNGTVVAIKGSKSFKATKLEAAEHVGDLTTQHINETLEKISELKEGDKYNITITIEPAKKK